MPFIPFINAIYTIYDEIVIIYCKLQKTVIWSFWILDFFLIFPIKYLFSLVYTAGLFVVQLYLLTKKIFIEYNWSFLAIQVDQPKLFDKIWLQQLHSNSAPQLCFSWELLFQINTNASYMSIDNFWDSPCNWLFCVHETKNCLMLFKNSYNQFK